MMVIAFEIEFLSPLNTRSERLAKIGQKSWGLGFINLEILKPSLGQI